MFCVFVGDVNYLCISATGKMHHIKIKIRILFATLKF